MQLQKYNPHVQFLLYFILNKCKIMFYFYYKALVIFLHLTNIINLDFLIIQPSPCGLRGL